MPTCFETDFFESKKMHGDARFLAMLRQAFPTAIEAYECPERYDRAGWDIALLTSETIFGLDIKFRSKDPRSWGCDDLAIELWSNVEANVRGYTSNLTDYIVWYYQSTGRVVVVPYSAFKHKIDQYRSEFVENLKLYTQETFGSNGRTYRSIHCYVPLSLFSDIAFEMEPNAVGRRVA